MAGTAGVAALTAAVVVPVTVAGGASSDRSKVAINPAATRSKTAHCKTFLFVGKHRTPTTADLQKARLKAHSLPGHGRVIRLRKSSYHGRELLAITNCAHGIGQTAQPADSGPTGPTYTYTEDPQHISDRLGAQLASDIAAKNLTVIYTRPFAQETSTLESGHPSYYAGNVDVKVGDTLGDIGVQVNHPTTARQPFDGTCDGSGFAECQRTNLPDGSVLQTDRVHVATGEYIVEAQVSRTDGTVVQVQESNYAFGPEATRSYGDQPLPLSDLVAMAEDPAYSF
jgi:hypothetical protein